MKRDACIDFHMVADEHVAVHQRLEAWAAWVRVRPSGWQVAPMFRQYRSKSWQWETPVTRAQLNIPEAVEMEKAVSLLPEKHREAIRWNYVFRTGPAKARRMLGVTDEGLARLVRDARQMLINRSV